MVTVRTACEAERRSALRLLLSELPSTERELQIAQILSTVSQGSLSLDGLLVADEPGRSDGLLGVILVLQQPDGCGFLWPPVVDAVRVLPAESTAITDDLLQAACRELDAADAWLGQCLLDEGDPHAAEMQRNGFQHITTLRYLQRFVVDPVTACDNPTRLQIRRLDPDDSDDAAAMAALIAQTYEGSHDCPELSGLRSGQEAIAGHRATGSLLRDQWLIFDDGVRDVGLLIFADHPEQNAWELVYTGVAASARGRGYGREIVLRGLQNAVQSERDAVLLAVDDRNTFAQKIYESLGFLEIAAKAVFVRPKPPSAMISE